MDWSKYKSISESYGATRREREVKRAKSYIDRHLPDNPAYECVSVDGVDSHLSIVSTTHSNIMRICGMPGTTLPAGKLVDWDNSKWLIVELDFRDEIYPRAKMIRCNMLLKWMNEDGNVVERWSVVEDGTKYLIGEKEKEVMTIGDSRLALTIGKDEETIKIHRGRRFLIGDTDSNPGAYQVTKENKLYDIYDGEGSYRFILREDQIIATDNTELFIANYYDAPDEPNDQEEEPGTDPQPSDEGVWI